MKRSFRELSPSGKIIVLAFLPGAILWEAGYILHRVALTVLYVWESSALWWFGRKEGESSAEGVRSADKPEAR